MIPTWPFMEGMKKCAKCREWQSLCSFTRLHSTKDGLQYQCRTCHQAGVLAAMNKQSIELKDCYVKSIIAKTVGLPFHLIPPALVEAKRLQLKLFRMTHDRDSR
jgi:hypothetical protein